MHTLEWVQSYWKKNQSSTKNIKIANFFKNNFCSSRDLFVAQEFMRLVWFDKKYTTNNHLIIWAKLQKPTHRIAE